MKKIIITLLFLFPVVVFAYTPEQQTQIDSINTKFNQLYEAQADANIALENKITAYNRSGNVSNVLPDSYYKQMAHIQAEDQLKLDKIRLEQEIAITQLKASFTVEVPQIVPQPVKVVHTQPVITKKPQVVLPAVDWKILFLLRFCLGW